MFTEFFLIIKEHNPEVAQATLEKCTAGVRLHLQVGCPQAIQLSFFFPPPPLASHGHSDSKILSWAQGLTLPLNTESYQLFAVTGTHIFPLAGLNPCNTLTFKSCTS